MILQHLIITTFNLKGCDATQKNEPFLTPKELHKFFVVFENYCLPSMAQQSNQNFIWLCFFDIETSTRYKRKFERYRKYCPQFRPVCITLNQDEKISPKIKKAIQTYIDPKATHLLTTNLKSYHSIHKDMIQHLQKHIYQQKEEGLYNFSHGFHFFENTDLVVKTKNIHYFKSLFVKKEANLQNFHYCCHTHLNLLFKTNEICSDQPMWLEIIHSHHTSKHIKLMNKRKNHCPKKSLDLSAYGLYFKLSTPKYFYNAFIAYPHLFIKTIIFKLNKKRLMLLNMVSVF